MPLAMIANTVAPVFYKLLYMSVTALAVGAVIMLIRRFADRRFSPFWKCAMWTLVIAAFVVPWRPQSGLSVMNNTEKIQEISFYKAYTHARTEYAEYYDALSGELAADAASYERLTDAKGQADLLYVKTLVFDSVIPALWFCGTVIIGLFTLFCRLRFGKKIKNSKIAVETARYDNILSVCKQRLGIKRRVRLVFQSYVRTPALFDLLRPKIVLPEYTQNLGDGCLEHIIIHELSHLKRGDTIGNALLIALQTVYWFNPLTWFLFKFMREDMELANDAAVLKGMGEKEQKEYSLSLVKVLAQHGKPSFTPRLICMVDSEKNMTRRINMIKLSTFFKRRRFIIAISGLLVISLTAALFLTVGATGEDEYKIKTTEEITDRVEAIPEEYVSGEAEVISEKPEAKAPKISEAAAPEKSEAAAPEKTEAAAPVKSEPQTQGETVPNISEGLVLYKSAKEVESISDERLINHYLQKDEFVIPDYYEPDDFGVRPEQGETWHEISSNSVCTADAAKDEADAFALKQKPASHTVDYIGENKYYYEFRLRYILGKTTESAVYTVRVIVYKDSAKYCGFSSQTGYFAEIRALDRSSVLELLDLEVFLHYGVRNTLYRELTETGGEYIYTLYRIGGGSGDWGVNDRVTLEKITLAVNKKTGAYKTIKSKDFNASQRQVLKDLEVPGTAKRLIFY